MCSKQHLNPGAVLGTFHVGHVSHQQEQTGSFWCNVVINVAEPENLSENFFPSSHSEGGTEPGPVCVCVCLCVCMCVSAVPVDSH